MSKPNAYHKVSLNIDNLHPKPVLVKTLKFPLLTKTRIAALSFEGGCHIFNSLILIYSYSYVVFKMAWMLLTLPNCMLNFGQAVAMCKAILRALLQLSVLPCKLYA